MDDFVSMVVANNLQQGAIQAQHVTQTTIDAWLAGNN